MKIVRGVFETAGVALALGLAFDMLALCGLGETALLIAVMMPFFPVILLYSLEIENLYILFQIFDGCKHPRNVFVLVTSSNLFITFDEKIFAIAAISICM